MKIEFIIPTVISIAAIIWSFFQNKIIEQLKQENTKRVLVHKLQFEKEFEVYKEIWGHLVTLRESAKSLAPEFYKIYENDPEFKKTQITEFGKNLLKISALIENNKPFYSIEIYNILLKIIKLTKPILDWSMENKTEEQIHENWNVFHTQMNAIVEITENVCDGIRNRIGNLYV